MQHFEHIEACHVNPTTLVCLHVHSKAVEHEEEGYPDEDFDDATREFHTLEVTTLLDACLVPRPCLYQHGHEHDRDQEGRHTKQTTDEPQDGTGRNGLTGYAVFERREQAQEETLDAVKSIGV